VAAKTKATAQSNSPESFPSVDLFQRQRRPLAYLRRFLRHVDAQRSENGLPSALRAHPIRHLMPVILPLEAFDFWLDCAEWTR
jgi:hypothetical protein